MKKLFFTALIAVMVVMGCKKEEDVKCVKTLTINNETMEAVKISFNGSIRCDNVGPGGQCSIQTTQGNAYNYEAIGLISNTRWAASRQGECFDQSVRLTNPQPNGPCVKTLTIINDTPGAIQVSFNGVIQCGYVAQGDQCSIPTTQGNTYNVEAVGLGNQSDKRWTGSKQGECFDQSLRLVNPQPNEPCIKRFTLINGTKGPVKVSFNGSILCGYVDPGGQCSIQTTQGVAYNYFVESLGNQTIRGFQGGIEGECFDQSFRITDKEPEGPCIKTLTIINGTPEPVQVSFNGTIPSGCGYITPGGQCSIGTTQGNTYNFQAVGLGTQSTKRWSGSKQGECFDQSVRLTY